MPPDPLIARLRLANPLLAAADHALRRYALSWASARPPFGLGGQGLPSTGPWAPWFTRPMVERLAPLTHPERIAALTQGVTSPAIGLILNEEGAEV